ncbi:hypothetical protein DYB32_001083 [Aphanomyces invadans]|uniref:Uncharacterized protein n=1 Tax=Aphanomyces invadans TaxID=157072 RepID=A0A3R6Z9X4_9STRA|nr:hypothetical protein DYB32_001083 [Aphanomyces invadans]
MLSRGMALFKGGKIERAHEDFSCGEFGRAIQDYTIALQFDEHGHDKGFLRGESRLYLHETAEKAINDKLSLSYRARDGVKGKADAMGITSPPKRPSNNDIAFKTRSHPTDLRKPLPSTTMDVGRAQVARVTIDLTKPAQPVAAIERHANQHDHPRSISMKTIRTVKRVTVAL